MKGIFLPPRQYWCGGDRQRCASGVLTVMGIGSVNDFQVSDFQVNDFQVNDFQE